jgi:hypothetical protein
MTAYTRGTLDRKHVARGNGSVIADPLIHCLRRDAQQASNTGLAGTQFLDGSGDGVHGPILSITLVRGQAMLSYNLHCLSGQSSDA